MYMTTEEGERRAVWFISERQTDAIGLEWPCRVVGIGAERGSFLEAHINLRLAVFLLRRNLWLAWPASVRRIVPAPRPWWRVI